MRNQAKGKGYDSLAWQAIQGKVTGAPTNTFLRRKRVSHAYNPLLATECSLFLCSFVRRNTAISQRKPEMTTSRWATNMPTRKKLPDYVTHNYWNGKRLPRGDKYRCLPGGGNETGRKIF